MRKIKHIWKIISAVEKTLNDTPYFFSYVAHNVFLLDSTALEKRGFVTKFIWEKLDIPFSFKDL